MPARNTIDSISVKQKMAVSSWQAILMCLTYKRKLCTGTAYQTLPRNQRVLPAPQILALSNVNSTVKQARGPNPYRLPKNKKTVAIKFLLYLFISTYMLAMLTDTFERTQFFPKFVVGYLVIFLTTIRCNIAYHASVVHIALSL